MGLFEKLALGGLTGLLKASRVVAKTKVGRGFLRFFTPLPEITRGVVKVVARAPVVLPTPSAPSLGRIAGKGVVAVGKQFAKAPVKTAAAGLIGIPLVAGIIADKPSALVTIPVSAFKKGRAIAKTVRDKPVVAGVLGAVGLGAVAATAVVGAKGLIPFFPSGAKAPSIATQPPPKAGIVPVSPLPVSAPVPVTPQTQVLGTEAGVTKKKKPRRRRAPSAIQKRLGNRNYQRVNVNILNSSKSSANRRYKY